ncbi:MAG: SCO family protein [Pseudomonadota bacterium]
MTLRTVAIAAAVGLSALIGGTAAYVFLGSGPDNQFAQCLGSTVAGGADTIGGPFTLVNGEGVTVTDTDVITEPSLLYFGYTFCPDVCPLDNLRNAEATVLLEEQGLIATPIFISIDPARDTPAVVSEFAMNFHDRMVGLTGSEEQVRAVAQTYKTYYNPQGTLEDDPYYLVDHMTFTYFVMPQYGFVDFFRRDDSPKAVAERVACVINAA